MELYDYCPETGSERTVRRGQDSNHQQRLQQHAGTARPFPSDNLQEAALLPLPQPILSVGYLQRTVPSQVCILKKVTRSNTLSANHLKAVVFVITKKKIPNKILILSATHSFP